MAEKFNLKKESYVAVYVEWLDSVSPIKIWHDFGDIVKNNKEVSDRFQSIAYLIYENKLEYVFCNSIHFEDGVAVAAGKIFKIPKGCVTKIKKISKI